MSTIQRVPVVVAHAGAGSLNEELREHEADRRSALEEALRAAAAALEAGRGALGAVEAAVLAMESFPLFNAGYGSVLCADGSARLSAAVMRGSDRAAGAVTEVRRTWHPVSAALLLLEEPEVLLAGEDADAFAAAGGLEQRDPSAFITERQRRRLDELQGDGQRGEQGTVGAICLDAGGLLAAATSTGGRLGQPPGRVGDTPLIGAGTWADGHVAVSCTGDGEAFIRAGAARLLGALVEQGMALEVAAQRALSEAEACGGSGGLIAVDARGNLATPYSSEAMPRGVWRAGQPILVEVV